MAEALLLPFVNQALAHLGEPLLADLQEQGSRAARMRVWLEGGRLTRALQRQFVFGFTNAECIPPRDPVDGIGTFRKRYVLPEDCLMVRAIAGLGADDWEMAAPSVAPVAAGDVPDARILACNVDAPKVTYSRHVENPAGWDDLFGHVFALELAILAAPSFGKSVDRIEQMRSQRNEYVTPAKRRSAQERARRAFPGEDVPFLAARRGSWRRR